MPVTFTCDSFENIMMFEKVAKKLLILMGNSETVPGAILADDIASALENLEAGLKTIAADTPVKESASEDEELEISLALRAVPLIQMLHSALKHHQKIMWS